MNSTSVLSIRDMHLSISQFGGLAQILGGVNIDIRPGERVAIVGESGCGKTSTALLAMGLIRGPKIHRSGKVLLEGEDVSRHSERQWHGLRGNRISMIFQDPATSLNPVFTIGDQLITVIRRANPNIGYSEARSRAIEGLLKVHIRDPKRIMDSFPFQLSGGLNQRVLITMGLINKPAVIIADEPGSALDVTVQRQTLELMKSLTEEMHAAVLIITHNLGVVREFAHRAYIMYSGVVVEEADTKRLFSEPLHPYTRRLIDSVPRLSGVGLPVPIEGQVPDVTRQPPGCRFEPRCPHAVDRCLQQPPWIEKEDGRRVACVLYG